MADPETFDSSDHSDPGPGPTRENVNPQSIEGLFLIALEKKTPAERTQFLDEMCGDNVEQRRRVEALLMAYDDAGSFLEKSPVGSSAPQPISLDFLKPSDDPDLLGMLGEYEIQEVIGQGGMGIVFRALDPKLNRIVAIKVMSPLLAVNANARKRFLREAQAAAAVSHPHIVTIHAVDEDKLPYLVMEYVVGLSLQEKLDKDGSLPVTEILRIGNQIADGLAAAHKQGLIHRDIKPANILLENGVERVKITDFGLARAEDDVTITRTGEVSGTPQYMSPEQATGERVDQRSDLFSLGAVLYAMCTGRSPFRASNLAAVVRRVCDDTPRPIEEVNEDIPDWLSEMIYHLLEKRPDDRFQTAEEVADLLGAHLARVQQPTYDPHISRPSKYDYRKQVKAVSRRGRRGGRIAIWLGGLILLVPLFLWGIGTAGGGHFASSVEEMVLVSLLFCVPVGLLLMVCGAQNIVQPGSTWAKVLDGLFLLGCIFAGPLGILLYIVHYMKKRDVQLDSKVEQRVTVSPSDDRVAEEQRKSNKRVIVGVVVGIGLLLLLAILKFSWEHLESSHKYWIVSWILICGVMAGLFVGVKFFRAALSHPWKSIGWLVLSGMLLFPCLFVVYLLLPMLARLPGDVVIIDYDKNYPLISISTDSINVDSKTYFVHSRPFKFKLTPGKHELRIKFNASGETISFKRNVVKEDGKPLRVNLSSDIQRVIRETKNEKLDVADQKKNRGGILLSGQTPHLRAGIFPVDSVQAKPEDGVFGFADRFFVLEPTTYEVPAGFYDIKVSSMNAGWIVDHSNPQFPFSTIEVKPGEIASVEISRDYKQLAKNQPNWSLDALFEFVWPVTSKTKISKRFKLSIQDAKVVQQLLEAFADGKPDVAEADLLKTANTDSDQDFDGRSLKQLFNDGKHPAWGTLIVPGKTENTFRLAEPK